MYYLVLRFLYSDPVFSPQEQSLAKTFWPEHLLLLKLNVEGFDEALSQGPVGDRLMQSFPSVVLSFVLSTLHFERFPQSSSLCSHLFNVYGRFNVTIERLSLIVPVQDRVHSLLKSLPMEVLLVIIDLNVLPCFVHPHRPLPLVKDG